MLIANEAFRMQNSAEGTVDLTRISSADGRKPSYDDNDSLGVIDSVEELSVNADAERDCCSNRIADTTDLIRWAMFNPCNPTGEAGGVWANEYSSNN